MTEEGEGSKRRSFLFADAVQAINSTLRGQVVQQQTRSNSSSSRNDDAQSRPTKVNAQHLTNLRPCDTFPELSLDRLGGILQLDETAQGQIKAAYEEAKLNWDLDAKLVGGHRSDGNLGMARVFGLLNVISLADNDTRSAQEGSTGGHIDSNGNLVAAPAQQKGAASQRGKVSSDGSEAKGTQKVFQRQYETHDLLRAIDRKDTQTILTIRDANFDLLLDLSQGGMGASMSSGTVNTPLGYCIGLGKEWEGVAVVLTGALSKFVNNLPDEEEDLPTEEVAGSKQKTKTRRAKRELDPRTVNRLRKLRTSLKLAIDHSISIDQTRLLSSYLQVLLMSTGQSFIRETIDSVHQALVTLFSGSQVSSTGKIMSNTDPFQVALQAITSFFTDSLKTKSQLKDVSQRIASVDDLIDNCVGDFIVMAIWQDIQLYKKELARIENEEKRKQADTSSENDQLLVELPTWSFARDDRIISLFTERVWNLEKVLDMIQWESKGRIATSATKSSRNSRIFKYSKEIVENLGTQKKRLSSKDRLAFLHSLIH